MMNFEDWFEKEPLAFPDAHNIAKAAWNDAIKFRNNELLRQEPVATVVDDFDGWTKVRQLKPLCSGTDLYTEPKLRITWSQHEALEAISTLCPEIGDERIPTREALVAAKKRIFEFIVSRPDPSAWEPIKTAPDFTRVFLYAKQLAYGHDTRFITGVKAMHPIKGMHWQSSIGEVKPTHWMPIPLIPHDWLSET